MAQAALPIRRIVLYKHGVGYFERHGAVDGDAEVELHFRAAEMDDVLKSLIAADLDGGLISNVSYESTKPVEKRLEDIAIRLADKNSLTGLLAQVKGARVAVEAGSRKVEGVVMGIESIERKEAQAVATTHYLNLFVGGATVQSFDLMEVKGLHFLDEGLRQDLQHLLDVLILSKRKDLKKLTILCKGKGKRRLLASYTIETPVWKTSYRFLLSGARATVQGWAIVDNTQEQDWNDVSLTLVAGLPISFVHDLYSPRYKKRPVVRVQEEEAYAPPVLEEALLLSGKERRLSAKEAGADLGSIEHLDIDAARPARDGAAARAAARERSVEVHTRTAEVGDLFQYEITNAVSVRRNQSALVPILRADLHGRRVAVYNPEVREKNPMSAIFFRNTTGMTLEGGPVTVLEDDSYVGESMLDTMKPDEERLVPFSVELGCAVTVDHKSEIRDVHFARVAGGKLHLHRYRVQRRLYDIVNKTPRRIELYLEHRFTPGWDLVETPEPVERTPHFYRFRIEVPEKKTLRFAVNEKGEETEAIGVHNAGREQLRVWVESRYIDRKTADALEVCVALWEKAATLVRRIGEREKEIAEIAQDQERLRKNLQALGGSQDEKGLRERYVADLSRHEDRIAEARAESKRMREDKDRLEDDLRARLGQLRSEVAL